MEEWRPIPGLDHYEASSEGRIRSVAHSTTFVGRWGTLRTHHYPGKVLSLKRKPNGWGGVYLGFTVGHDGGAQVNRSVCAAFHGPAPCPDHEAAHLDGDTLNNRPGNLIWATPLENAAHKNGHGTAPIGERNGAARLRAEDIEPIFDRFSGGEKSKDIAESLGVSVPNVLQILRRETWAHVCIPAEKVRLAKARAAENIALARREENERRSRLARGVPRPQRACSV